MTWLELGLLFIILNISYYTSIHSFLWINMLSKILFLFFCCLLVIHLHMWRCCLRNYNAYIYIYKILLYLQLSYFTNSVTPMALNLWFLSFSFPAITLLKDFAPTFSILCANYSGCCTVPFLLCVLYLSEFFFLFYSWLILPLCSYIHVFFVD